MIEVSKYQSKDQPDVVRLVTEFYHEALSEYDNGLDIDTLLKVIDSNKDLIYVLKIDDKCEGVLAGMKAESMLNGNKMFQELVWYVSKKSRRYGIKLLREVEKALKEDGYSAIVMVCIHNSKTEKLFKFYKSLGYRELETQFIRSLQ